MAKNIIKSDLKKQTSIITYYTEKKPLPQFPNKKERIEFAKLSKNGKNCIGTALFISGVLPEERGIDPMEAPVFLDELEELQKPLEGCLITFWEKDSSFPWHMGIVTATNPMQIVHRTEWNGPVEEKINLNLFLSKLKNLPRIAYYNNLTKLIEPYKSLVEFFNKEKGFEYLGQRFDNNSTSNLHNFIYFDKDNEKYFLKAYSDYSENLLVKEQIIAARLMDIAGITKIKDINNINFQIDDFPHLTIHYTIKQLIIGPSLENVIITKEREKQLFDTMNQVHKRGIKYGNNICLSDFVLDTEDRPTLKDFENLRFLKSRYEKSEDKANLKKLIINSLETQEKRQRNISRQEILASLRNPDYVFKKQDKFYYQKKLDRGFIEFYWEATGVPNIKEVTCYWL